MDAPSYKKAEWRQHEERVEEAARKAFPDEQFRVAAQREVVHRGQDKREDVHVAERVQGGRGVVLDAKHFANSPLSKHEIDTTLAYQRDGRDSLAVVVVSKDTYVPPATQQYAEQQGVVLVRDNRNLVSNLQKAVADVGGSFSQLSLSHSTAPDTPVDRRCSAVATGALHFNANNTVDRRSAAVHDGSVLVTASGQVDRRCSAVRNGEVTIKPTYTASASSSSYSSPTPSPSSCTSSGHEMHTGPRGGSYYISDSGSKVYSRK